MDTLKGKFLLTPQEAKIILRIGHNRVYEIFNRADFPKIVIGKKYLVRQDALLEWIKEQEQQG